MVENKPETIINSNGVDVTLTWIKTKDVESYTPYYQVYGIVFNNNGEILLIKEKNKWKIPGGTPEDNESPIETLERELIEEADVKIKDIRPLGVQKVVYPNNPNKEEGDLYYQYRYIASLDELLPSTPDPDTGLTNVRMFVPAHEVTVYVKWGEVGAAMFSDAYNLYKQLKG